MQVSVTSNNRIIIVDALRGFALTGIMLLHALEHFDFFWEAAKNPQIFHPIDPHIFNVVKFLFGGKAYAIFSLMFGLSFFIQMDRNAKRGIDFRWRFLWRLIVLFTLGYLHSMWYSGDILTMYAFCGLFLIPLYHVNKAILLGIAILLVLQIPTIYNIIQFHINPDYELNRNFGRGLWGELFNLQANGSFGEVIRFNAYKGRIAVISWSYYNGRYLQMFGLFLFGLVLGKNRFFERIDEYKKLMPKVLIISIIITATLSILLKHLHDFELARPHRRLYYTIIKSYADLAFMTGYISLLSVFYQYFKNGRFFSVLANYGRMSLTSYIMQPLIGAPVFYGYGLAMYHYFGSTLSFFYGVIFLVFQLWFCKYWLKRYHYGPLEWLWRAVTYFNFKLKFKKITD